MAETSPLRDLARARGLLIGAAVAARPLAEEARYREVLAREFSSLTCENVMKPMYLQPERGRFDFAAADEVVAFAARHEIAVRGHTLVWHRQNPEWLVQAVESGGAGEQPAILLQEHIHAVLAHYRQAFPGRVEAWDVVNEAVADDGGPRDTLWRRALGPDYVASAFRWAHAADPDVRLFYNDYGADGLGKKSDAVYALLRELKDAGVPVHGVGLQMHVGIGAGHAPAPQDVAANVARLAALGLEVHVTEMDVKLQTGEGTPEQRLEEQARVYAHTLEVCLSGGVPSFTLWGFTDAHSWISRRTGRDDAPLPLDASCQPKPAYHALVRALTA
jgi:endo-1,4-beta-xylanase